MIAITATTCRSVLLEEYQRCCGYDLDADVATCRQFIRVCRALLSPRYPQEAQTGSRAATSSLTIAVGELSQQLATAERWLAANDPTYQGSLAGGGVVYASLGNLRDD